MQTRRVQPTRRQVLVRTAAAGAALTLSSALAPLFAAPEKRSFQIGVCEWMLGKAGGTPGSLDVCKEIGADGMQANMGNVGNGMQLCRPEVRKAYLDAAARTGMKISSIGVAEMNNVPLKSDERAEPWLAQSVEAAKALGVTVVLLAFFHKNDLRDDPAGTDRCVELLKRAMPAAERAGIVYGIESWLSAEDHVKIIDRVGSKNLQVYYDVGNSHLRGYDIYKEIRWLGAERICEFHAKDYNHIFGQGKVDFERVRRAMDDVGYAGWIQIEGATPLGLMESYKKDREYLKQVFPAAT